MAKNRPEDTNVIAPAITCPNHRPWSQLVGNPKARSEVVVVVVDVEIPADASHPTYSQVTGAQVEERTIAVAVHIFRIEDVPAQPVVDGQLGSNPPRVLTVEVIAPLALGCGCDRAGVAFKGSDITEQECSNRQTARGRCTAV